MRVFFCADPLHPRRVDEAYQAEYDAARSGGAEVSLVDFEALVYEISQTIPSPFFTMDVAKLRASDWRIIELGDAQVADLPPETDVQRFYADLRTRAEAAGVSAG